MASNRADWSPRETAGPTRASVCSRWSTTFASSGEVRRRPAAREREPRPRLLQRRMTKEHLRRSRLLSEAGGAEVLAQRVPPERVGGGEAPGVRERELRANASVASPLASAGTTQAGLICVLGPKRRLCRAERRLARGHDPSIRGRQGPNKLIFTVAAILKSCGQVNRNRALSVSFHYCN